MNELSDVAFWECTDGMTRLQAWQECRRRAEAIIEEEKRKAFAAGFDKGMCSDDNLDEAYRAYQAEQKE
jgi:hypothetical protein